MGVTRSNQPREVTEEKIRDLLRSQLAMEQTAFPSERELRSGPAAPEALSVKSSRRWNAPGS